LSRKLYVVYGFDVTDSHDFAWRSFLETYARTVRKLERELADESDLPLTWYDALVQLHEAGGTMRVGDLANHLLISRSATTRFVDRLERNGLIERQVLDSDRRGTLVVLTQHGRATLRQAAPTHLRGIQEHFSSKLTESEAIRLGTLLEKIKDS
jgi:DNA-binding MarR family transcriptional regulator